MFVRASSIMSYNINMHKYEAFCKNMTISDDADSGRVDAHHTISRHQVSAFICRRIRLYAPTSQA